MEAPPTIDLKSLGISPSDLQDRIVERATEKLIEGYADPESRRYVKSDLEERIQKEVTKRIDETVERVVDEHFGQSIGEYVESLTLQETTNWGEKKGEPISFIEYLVRTAHEYMHTKVDYNGKSRDESTRSYDWKGKQTRLAWMIHDHLHNQIERAMKQMIENANSELATTLQETTKIKLQEIAEKLKVEVKAGR